MNADDFMFMSIKVLGWFAACLVALMIIYPVLGYLIAVAGPKVLSTTECPRVINECPGNVRMGPDR